MDFWKEILIALAGSGVLIAVAGGHIAGARTARRDMLVSYIFDKAICLEARQIAYWEYMIKGYNGAVNTRVEKEMPEVLAYWLTYRPTFFERISARFLNYPRPQIKNQYHKPIA